MRRLAAALVAAAALLGLAPTAAAAPAQIDVCDSQTPPVPELPGRGTWSDLLLPTPTPPPPPRDPWAANPQTSIYEQYGMAGMTYHTYDLGCIPDGDSFMAVFDTSTANVILGVAEFGLSVTGGLLEAAYNPGQWLGVLDPAIAGATRALWDAVTEPLSAIVVLVLGVMLVFNARRWAWSKTLGAVGLGVVAFTVAAVIVGSPTQVASMADDGMTTAAGAAYESVNGKGGGTNPATEATASAYDAILWPQWLKAHLGSTDSEVALRYGPDLFRASAFTWAEAAQVQDDPDAMTALVERKNENWVDTANAIRDADPDAYAYLTSNGRADRTMNALLAVAGTALALPFLAASGLLLIGAFLVLRLLVVFGPLIAPIAILVPSVGKSALLTAGAAVVNSVIFAMGSAVTVLLLGFLTDPASGLPGWLGLLLMAVFSATMWLLLKPFRRLTRMVGKVDVGQNVSALTDTGREWAGNAKGQAWRYASTYAGSRHGSRDGAVAAAEAISEEQERPESFSRQEDGTYSTGPLPPERVAPAAAPVEAKALGAAAAPAAAPEREEPLEGVVVEPPVLPGGAAPAPPPAAPVIVGEVVEPAESDAQPAPGAPPAPVPVPVAAVEAPAAGTAPATMLPALVHDARTERDDTFYDPDAPADRSYMLPPAPAEPSYTSDGQPVFVIYNPSSGDDEERPA